MRNLIKYLTPFKWSIVLIFILLFGQAMSNLAVPNLLSDIVDIGVQQHGIENPAPNGIRASEMSKVTLFMSDTDKATVSRDYTLLDKQSLSSSDYAKDLKAYPGLANGPIYILNSAGEADIAQLNTIFSKPIFLVSIIEQNGLSAYGVNLPPGVDPFTALSQLPASQLNTIRQEATAKLNTVPASLINQSDVNYLFNEYNAVGINVNHIQTFYMLKIGGFMLLLTLASMILAIIVGFIAARVAAAFGRNVRQKLFTKVENFSNNEFDKFSTASLITRTTNDIQQTQLVLVMLLRVIFFAPLMGIGGIILAVQQDTSMTWIIGAAVGVLLAMIGITFSVALPKFRIIQKLVDKLNLVTREMLSGIMVVRAFNTQAHEEQRFDKANVDLTGVSLFIAKLTVYMMPAMMLLMNGAMLLIVWFGAHQVSAGSMQVGNMMAFMQYTMQIIFAFLMVTFVFIMLPQATVSVQRISEVLDTEFTINDPVNPQKFPEEVKGLVQFNNVSFKYPGAEDYVLHNITFTARPGQTTAIVGGTGSGKSTLINLIPRFYDVTEGNILVDNTDIRSVPQYDLRDKIGYVPQKTVLFSGTIKSNILYSNQNATDEEIEKAAETAQAMEFISECEDGFDTSIAQAGTNLSGGQKQRLTIARALAKRPEIYIFDDSFSAIDYKTDAALRKALRKEVTDSTVLIVGQRISTIRDADQIIVMDNGKMVGIGTHKELMDSCQVYQELALSQLSKEELIS